MREPGAQTAAASCSPALQKIDVMPRSKGRQEENSVRPSVSVDQLIDLITHHPIAAAGFAALAALLSWVATRGGDRIR